jgi:hypothetical protein
VRRHRLGVARAWPPPECDRPRRGGTTPSEHAGRVRGGFAGNVRARCNVHGLAPSRTKAAARPPCCHLGQTGCPSEAAARSPSRWWCMLYARCLSEHAVLDKAARCGFPPPRPPLGAEGGLLGSSPSATPSPRVRGLRGETAATNSPKGACLITRHSAPQPRERAHAALTRNGIQNLNEPWIHWMGSLGRPRARLACSRGRERGSTVGLSRQTEPVLARDRRLCVLSLAALSKQPRARGSRNGVGWLAQHADSGGLS